MTERESATAPASGIQRSALDPSPQRSALTRLAVLMATGCMDMMGMLMVLPLVPFYAKAMGASDTMVGVLAGSHAFAALVTAPLWGRLSDRYGRRPAILLGLVASSVAFLIFGLTDNLWVLLLSRLVQGAGAGTIGVVQAYVSDTVEPNQRAKALGFPRHLAGVMLGRPLPLATRPRPHAPGFIAPAWRWQRRRGVLGATSRTGSTSLRCAPLASLHRRVFRPPLMPAPADRSTPPA